MRNLFLLILLCISPVLMGQDTTKHYTLTFNSSNVKILSEAYLHYGSNFHDVLGTFQFDSTLFNERYNDTMYAGTSKRKEFHTAFRDGEVGDIYSNSGYKPLLGIIKKYKIGPKDYWGISLAEGDKDFYTFNSHMTKKFFSDIIFPEFQSKKELKVFLSEQEVCDHRIYLNKNTDIFELELKGKSGFEKYVFFPYLTGMENMTDDEISKSNYENFMDYVKELYKTEAIYNKLLFKEIQKIKKERQKLLSKKWESFENMYMSEEEKNMGMDHWLNYYDLILEDEFKAIMNSEPKRKLLGRFLSETGYRRTDMDLINYNKVIKFKTDGLTPLIDQVTVINLSQNYYGHAFYNNANAFRVNLNSGDEYVFVLKLSDGNYGVIKETIPSEEEFSLEFKSIPRELVSIKMVSRKSGL